MTSSNTNDPAGAGSSDDLRGLEILLVEDSWSVGEAMKDLLELLGAVVVGPAATTLTREGGSGRREALRRWRRAWEERWRPFTSRSAMLMPTSSWTCRIV
jgi:CheY-like chemotaxis protein